MKITASRGDEQVSTDNGLDELWKLMGWPLAFKPMFLPSTYQGWSITAIKQIARNVKAPVNGKPHRRSSAVRLAKQHLGYTPSLRPLGETCSTCAYRLDRVCIKGGFTTKVKSGCDEWKPIND